MKKVALKAPGFHLLIKAQPAPSGTIFSLLSLSHSSDKPGLLRFFLSRHHATMDKSTDSSFAKFFPKLLVLSPKYRSSFGYDY